MKTGNQSIIVRITEDKPNRNLKVEDIQWLLKKHLVDDSITVTELKPSQSAEEWFKQKGIMTDLEYGLTGAAILSLFKEFAALQSKPIEIVYPSDEEIETRWKNADCAGQREFSSKWMRDKIKELNPSSPLPDANLDKEKLIGTIKKVYDDNNWLINEKRVHILADAIISLRH